MGVQTSFLKSMAGYFRPGLGSWLRLSLVLLLLAVAAAVGSPAAAGDLNPAIAAGSMHTIALQADGTLRGWGGAYANGSAATSVETPAPIGSDNTWTAIAAGESHGLALQSDRTLWAWGNNDFGQLGDGSKTALAAPAPIGNDSDWMAIAAGYQHSLALKTDGSLWAWGANNVGLSRSHAPAWERALGRSGVPFAVPIRIDFPIRYGSVVAHYGVAT